MDILEEFRGQSDRTICIVGTIYFQLKYVWLMVNSHCMKKMRY